MPTSVDIDIPFGGTDSFGNPGGYKLRDISTGLTGFTGPLPYSAIRTETTTVLFQRFASGVLGGTRYTNEVIPSSPVPPYTNLENKALTKLWSTIKETDFNSAIFLAESRPAATMIAENALRLATAWKRARSGDFRGASIALTGQGEGPRGRVANNWLQLQYGWLPLMKDVYDATDYLRKTKRLNSFSQVKQRSTEKHKDVFTNLHTYVQGLSQIEFGVEYGIVMSEDFKMTLADFSGITDPLTVAWELLPYSFVIDWWIPVGNAIQAAFAQRTLKVARYYRTRFATYSIAGASAKAGQVLVGDLSGHKTDRMQISRAAGTTLSGPRLPSFESLHKDPSVTRTLNALALLSQLTR